MELCAVTFTQNGAPPSIAKNVQRSKLSIFGQNIADLNCMLINPDLSTLYLVTSGCEDSGDKRNITTKSVIHNIKICLPCPCLVGK
ncbi:hypothetical protein AVEN_63872-1 [Araneus ventricosus]|uniref:Uncharacterized protein n=1 Tax=Araneus ventricosus TaxID=182803 RepID=A0A4Y2M3K9_ARAVE|nr:hypothetical protein AVEN_63872-1 [Araneus ventricosus]